MRPEVGEEESKGRSTFLHWDQRTEEINKKIEEAYTQVTNREEDWGYNGSWTYGLSGIDDWKMIQKIVADGLSAGQKDFVFMDIGAGNFQWGRDVAERFNADVSFAEAGVKVSIYSLRGERNSEEEVCETGICTRHEYGNFKIENLVNEFDRKGQNLSGKVDMIVSSWCFRHLVDPVGTLLQAYHQLKPESGLICFDGFFIEKEGEGGSVPVENYTSRMNGLLKSFNAPFFVRKALTESFGELCDFVMKKSSSDPELEMSYAGCYELESGGRQHVASGVLTMFDGIKELSLQDLQHHAKQRNSVFGIYPEVYFCLEEYNDFFLDTIPLPPYEVLPALPEPVAEGVPQLGEPAPSLIPEPVVAEGVSQLGEPAPSLIPEPVVEGVPQSVETAVPSALPEPVVAEGAPQPGITAVQAERVQTTACCIIQ